MYVRNFTANLALSTHTGLPCSEQLDRQGQDSRNSVTNSTVSPVKYNTKWHSLRRSGNKWSNKWRCACVHSLPRHLSLPLSTQALARTIWDSIAHTIQWYYPQNYTNLLGHAKRNNMMRYVGTSLFFTPNESQLIEKVKHFPCEISPNFLTASTSGPNCQLLFNNHKFFWHPFFQNAESNFLLFDCAPLRDSLPGNRMW